MIDVLYLGITGRRPAPRGRLLESASASPAPSCSPCSRSRTLASAMRVPARRRMGRRDLGCRSAPSPSLGATASSPLTIASWAAIFSAASLPTSSRQGRPSERSSSASGSARSPGPTLSAGLALARSRVGPRFLTAVDVVAMTVLLGFAALLGYRTIADPAEHSLAATIGYPYRLRSGRSAVFAHLHHRVTRLPVVVEPDLDLPAATPIGARDDARLSPRSQSGRRRLPGRRPVRRRGRSRPGHGLPRSGNEVPRTERVHGGSPRRAPRRRRSWRSRRLPSPTAIRASPAAGTGALRRAGPGRRGRPGRRDHDSGGKRVVA